MKKRNGGQGYSRSTRAAAKHYQTNGPAIHVGENGWSTDTSKLVTSKLLNYKSERVIAVMIKKCSMLVVVGLRGRQRLAKMSSYL